MALIDSNARIIGDEWNYPGAEGADAIGSKHVVPLAVLVAMEPDSIVDRPAGLYAAAGVTAEQIAPYLGRLDVIVIEFPKFRDGRGFTLARALRNRHGFKGDIRAIGHVLPDQFAALVQCGFTTILRPAEHRPEQWLQIALSISTVSGGPLLQRLIGRRCSTGVSTDLHPHFPDSDRHRCSEDTAGSRISPPDDDNKVRNKI